MHSGIILLLENFEVDEDLNIICSSSDYPNNRVEATAAGSATAMEIAILAQTFTIERM